MMAAIEETQIPDVASIPMSLREITRCSLCKETWRDPRYIPICDHTFCLPCLSKYTERAEGATNTHHCPTCRKEFSIPEGGVEALPKNHLHQQMLDALREQKETVQQKEDASSGNLPRFYCEWHNDEELKLYCLGCSKLVCSICCATEHEGHKISEIKDANKVLIKKIKDNTVTMEEGVVKYKKAFQQGEVKIKKRLRSLEIQQKLIALQMAKLERMQVKQNKMEGELKEMLRNQRASMTLGENENECDIIVWQTANKLLLEQAEIFANTAENGSALTKSDQTDSGFTPDVVQDVGGCQIQLGGSFYVAGVSASDMTRDFEESKKLIILTMLCDEIRTQDNDTESCDSKEQYVEEQIEKNDLSWDLILLNHQAADVPNQEEELNLIEDDDPPDLDSLDLPAMSENDSWKRFNRTWKHGRESTELDQYYFIDLYEDE